MLTALKTCFWPPLMLVYTRLFTPHFPASSIQHPAFQHSAFRIHPPAFLRPLPDYKITAPATMTKLPPLSTHADSQTLGNHQPRRPGAVVRTQSFVTKNRQNAQRTKPVACDFQPATSAALAPRSPRLAAAVATHHPKTAIELAADMRVMANQPAEIYYAILR